MVLLNNKNPKSIKSLLDFYEKRILSSHKTISFNHKHVLDQHISHKFQSHSFEMRGKRDAQTIPPLQWNSSTPNKRADIFYASVNTQLLLLSALNYEVMLLEFGILLSMEGSLNPLTTLAW